MYIFWYIKMKTSIIEDILTFSKIQNPLYPEED